MQMLVEGLGGFVIGASGALYAGGNYDNWRGVHDVQLNNRQSILYFAASSSNATYNGSRIYPYSLVLNYVIKY